MATEVTQIHKEHESLVIDVNLPGHDARVTTPLFTRSRDALIKREGNRSFVTGKAEQEVGSPLEAHHFFVERCLANIVDYNELKSYLKRLKDLVDRANAFCDANPELADIMDFVDNMEVNGMLIEKSLHTGKAVGIHQLPFPLYQAHFWGKDGYSFSDGDVLYHEDDHEAIELPEAA